MVIRQFRQSKKPMITRVWDYVCSFITWTPALDRFSSNRSKKLFKSFQIDTYICIVGVIMFGIIVSSTMFLIISMIEIFLRFKSSPKPILTSIILVLVTFVCLVYHIFALVFLMIRPKLFKSLYFLFIIVSLSLSEAATYTIRESAPGTFLATCMMIVFLFKATIYFHNSTILLVFSFAYEIGDRLISKILLVTNHQELFPGNVPVYQEVS